MSADDACQRRVGGVALQCKTLIEKRDTAFEIAGSPREPEGRERPCDLGDVSQVARDREGFFAGGEGGVGVAEECPRHARAG